jgi:hypothetical protein
MVEFQPEIRRTLERVEILEQLNLEYNITEEEYRSTHEVDGKIRAFVEPDSEVRRARKHPPVSIPERIVSALTESRSLALETGYPGTSFYVGLVCDPPTIQDDDLAQRGMSAQAFSLENIPMNGTVEMGKEWDLPGVEQRLSGDQKITTTHEYDIERYPSEHVPLVIRASIYRDAREQVEQRFGEIKRDIKNNPDDQLLKSEKKEFDRRARRLEGYAMLTLEVEHRVDSPEADRASSKRLEIENFRADLSSTFSDIEIWEEDEKASNYTYSPEKNRIEWRNSSARQGGTIKYNIVGPFNELIDIDHISASFRGEINRDTLTGAKIVGLFDQSGRAFRSGTAQSRGQSECDIRHTIKLKGTLEIDPEALAGDATTHTTSEIRLEEHPEDAFDRLTTICNREGITILSSEGFTSAEPVPGREGVFQYTAGEKGDADDRAARMEVKREFGNEGIVYADIQVTGKYTAVSQRSEVSAFDESDERVVRSDEGGLEERGKATIEIRARSTSSALNTEVIDKIERGLSGKGTRRTGSERGNDEQLPPRNTDRDRRELPNDSEREPGRRSSNGEKHLSETGNRRPDGGDS